MIPEGCIAPKTHHVWVRTPHVPIEHFGFLYWWRQKADGEWFGWVTWIDHSKTVHEPQWVPRAWIRPEESQRRLEGTGH